MQKPSQNTQKPNFRGQATQESGAHFAFLCLMQNLKAVTTGVVGGCFD
jgi:hypothetical protein